MEMERLVNSILLQEGKQATNADEKKSIFCGKTSLQKTLCSKPNEHVDKLTPNLTKDRQTRKASLKPI